MLVYRHSPSYNRNGRNVVAWMIISHGRVCHQSAKYSGGMAPSNRSENAR